MKKLLVLLAILAGTASAQQIYSPVYTALSQCTWPLQFITVSNGMEFCPLLISGSPAVAIAVNGGPFSLINQGQKGDPGQPASISVGSTVQTPPGTPPSVTSSGTPQNLVINFSLPAPQNGKDGQNPSVSVGPTTVLPAGYAPTVVADSSSTPTNLVLDFSLAPGLAGPPGIVAGSTVTGSGSLSCAPTAGTVQKGFTCTFQNLTLKVLSVN